MKSVPKRINIEDECKFSGSKNDSDRVLRKEISKKIGDVYPKMEFDNPSTLQGESEAETIHLLSSRIFRDLNFLRESLSYPQVTYSINLESEICD